MGDEESVGNSVALINWWDVHATSPSSWNTHHHRRRHHPANPNSNEDHDFSNASNHSTLSSNSFMPDQPSDNHLWTNVLLGVGSNEELQNGQAAGGGENLMDALSSKSIMYEEPACNYLKKLDHHKHFNGFNADADLTAWSIAPPDPQVFDHSGIFSSSFGAALDMKLKQHARDEAPPSQGLFGYQNNDGNGMMMMMPSSSLSSSSSCSRNLADVISFTGRIGRPVIGSFNRKQLFQTPVVPRGRSNGRGQGSSTEEVVIKKKRGNTADDASEAISKKPKQNDTCTASSNTNTNITKTKVQAPKVKLGDRITTLQQIVSPFGKTDTASVLFEAIGYIKFLQEQVQLLSNSYMKTNNSHKEAWGSHSNSNMNGMERRDNKEKGDLKSRGLCLVPISWTPQSYRDNTAPDYWTPAYRGCFFR